MVSAAPKRPIPPDPTHYPVEDDVGEGIVHKLVAELLRPLVERWLDSLGTPTFVGSNQFIYWVQYAPTRRVDPDVYVLPGVAPGADIEIWKVWETGIVPSFALEVVARDPTEAYELAPRRYAELGVRELVVFDPKFESAADRCRWQVFRRVARRGFVLVERTNADRVRSKVLDAWLRVVGEGAAARVRVASGARGEVLFPTEAEAAHAAEEAAHAAAEAARAAAKAERAAKDAESARRVQAETEVASLRAQLEALRRR